MFSVPVGMGKAKGDVSLHLCVRACVLLDICERRGRLLQHLATASCRITGNVANSIVPLVSHQPTPSDQ